MSESKVDQAPKITVLPDAGPEEMAKSAGCKPSELGWIHKRRGSSNKLSEEYKSSRGSGSSPRSNDAPAERDEIPGSKSGSGVAMADIQYHGVVDPDA